MKCPYCDEGSLMMCDVCDIPKWISVEDDLPKNKESKEFLTWVLGNEGTHLANEEYPALDAYNFELGWRSEYHKFGKVLYWMKLPKKPRETE